MIIHTSSFIVNLTLYRYIFKIEIQYNIINIIVIKQSLRNSNIINYLYIISIIN